MPTTASQPSTIERMVRHDRIVIGWCLVAITILCWTYLLRMGASMRASASEVEMHAAMGMAMPSMQTWGVGDLVSLFLMWAVMMIGMMLPSAAPMILLVVGTYRRRNGPGARLMTGAFLIGYLSAWTGFSAVAATTQLLLHRTMLLSSAMAFRSTMVGGAVLLVAGIYQWLPVKNACLTHCRSPLAFLSHEWREGASGAFVMGFRHGVFCVGCCWALMVLLFAVGVMNLIWVAVITVFVLVEKLAARAPWFSRLSGALLCAWGTYVLIASSALK